MSHAAGGGTVGSSGSSGDIDDYLAEVQDIEKSRNPEEPVEDDSKTPDEGEQEVAWLKDVGFAHLASKYEEGHMLDEQVVLSETATLTKNQAAAVKKRIDTLNATIRRREKHPPKTDVRDVWNSGAGQQRHRSDSSAPPGAKARESFMRNRGTYSITEGAKTSGEHASVETLSIQKKDPTKRHALSESDALDASLHIPEPDYDDGVASHKDTVEHSSAPVKKNPLGQTQVEDLGKQDKARIRSLALIELTTIYDISGVTYTRRKGKRKYLNEHGIYGVPLQTLLERDSKKHSHLTVPLFYKQLMECLMKTGVGEEGILRVPGSATRIKSLRQEIEDKFNSEKFFWDEVRPNDAAGLLKQFLRDLPVPLLSFEYIDAFGQLDKIRDQNEKLQALNCLILLLPDVHRNALRMLLEFLRKVSENSTNRMNIGNVSMIMAPNLFLVQSRRSKSKGIKDIELIMATQTASIVRLMIQEQDKMWTVPPMTMDQIRKQYEADIMKKSRDNKSIMKLLGRKDKSDAYRKPGITNESDFNDCVIRVKPSVRSKTSTAIKLDDKTTASDVLFRYQRLAPGTPEMNGRERDSSGDELESCSSLPDMASENTRLYEVGGNIGERRLAPDTNMMALYRANPNTDWIVKTKPG